MLRTARCLLPGVRTSYVQTTSVRNKSRSALIENATTGTTSKSSSLDKPPTSGLKAPFKTRPTSKRPSDQPQVKSKYKNELSRQSHIRPVVLSSRITELLDRGEVPAAIALVEDAKKGSTNVVTWNTLLKGLMDRSRRTTALKMFNNVSVCIFNCTCTLQ